jgi:hypothetical protein
MLRARDHNRLWKNDNAHLSVRAAEIAAVGP